jgi:hypothetical protein
LSKELQRWKIIFRVSRPVLESLAAPALARPYHRRSRKAVSRRNEIMNLIQFQLMYALSEIAWFALAKSMILSSTL